MVFYKLFLEKESMHHFKRFYLLGALVVSIVIPFITFTQYIEVAPVENLASYSPNESAMILEVMPEINANWQDYVPTILWSIYIIGALLFSFRFAINLRSILHRIKANPKHQYHEFTNVLLIDLIHPHTFFKYIFLNKAKYENNLIPNAVLLHEQTHAKQKHALDILCIEVLQIIFWFNPLLYFIKKDIKLNHEFLADQAVLQKGIDSSQYKQTLLTFSSNAREPQLTNAINYSLIKKRFTVMKTQTSRGAIWLRSLILLPLLAITLYSFSDTIIIEQKPPTDFTLLDQNTNTEQKKASKDQVKEYNQLAKKYNDMPEDNMVIKSSDLERLKYLYHLMSDTQKKNAESFPNIPAPPAPPAPVSIKVVSPNQPPPPPLPANATKAQKIKYKEAIRDAQVAAKVRRIKADKEKLVRVREIRTAEDRQKIEQEKRVYKESQIAARALKHKAQKERVQVREIRTDEDRKKLKQEKLAYKKAQVAARVQKAKAEKERRIMVREIKLPPPPLKKNATPEQKRRYEEAMKAYKLYEARKAKDNKSGKVKELPIAENVAEEEREQLIEVREAYHNELENINEIEIEEVPELEEVEIEEIENLIEVEESTFQEIEVEEVNETPSVSSLDHVIKMAKKGAIFYLEGKEISSDKAISLVKSKDKLHMSSRGIYTKQPKVYLYTKPIKPVEIEIIDKH
jgi:beta-lactamase regulating signal transducer with metallopeptidase domain